MSARVPAESRPVDETQSPLIVVDLAGPRFAQSLLLRVARRAIRRATSFAARRRSPRPRVLVHGDGQHFARLDGIELLSTLDYALPHVGSADEPWVNAVANEMLYGLGARYFPTVDGISLADLCRLEVQDYYLDYVHFAGAICRALAESPAPACRIFTIDPERAECLRSSIANYVPDAQAWTPPFLARFRQIGRALRQMLAGRKRADPHTTRLAQLRQSTRTTPLRAPVLFLSEAAPMTQMFEVVERHLTKSHHTPALRLELGGNHETVTVEANGSCTVAKFGHPLGLPHGSLARFRERWQTIARESRHVGISKPYSGASPVTPLRAPVRHLLEHLYFERFDQLAEHVEFAGTFVDIVRPEVVVVGNDRWWVGQAFVRAARQRGIPTLIVQDGMSGAKASWSWISADRMAAFSPALSDHLVAHGVSRDRIAITGQPRYDSLCAKRLLRGSVSVRAARARLKLQADAPCILLATQPHQTAARVGLAVEALLGIDGVQVLLRPHPNEPAGKYLALVAAHHDRVWLGTGITIDALLDASDMVVTEFSTVAVEGAILGMPVVIARFLGDRSDPQIFDGLGVLVARSSDELSDAARSVVAVSKLASASFDERRLHAVVGPLDGHAASRVAGLIHSLRTTNGVEPMVSRETECDRCESFASVEE